MTHNDKRPPPMVLEPPSGDDFAQQLREMNEALLLSSLHQHELATTAEQASTKATIAVSSSGVVR